MSIDWENENIDSSPTKKLNLFIQKTWNGKPISDSERVQVQLIFSPEGVECSFQAPFYDDPAPQDSPGPLWGLWGWEVFELFILGAEEEYTEVEVGPHGHHLVLRLKGRRNIIDRELPLDYVFQVEDHRWSGKFFLPQDMLPNKPTHFNLYTIHGSSDHRQFLAYTPVPGDKADFHRLEYFSFIYD